MPAVDGKNGLPSLPTFGCAKAKAESSTRQRLACSLLSSSMRVPACAPSTRKPPREYVYEEDDVSTSSPGRRSPKFR